ncbi:hypothetical protein CC80DRAFT_504181 [Byssothecium circinans]|uniref:Uncharacterized protein n=1 Tax=Byssothecium circinans TaxID=147558 RepID=A0A6A5TWS5_9PLEO|nr:hypothetical protein CC80DRAFT_504181 [Byssothecium circinans]
MSPKRKNPPAGSGRNTGLNKKQRLVKLPYHKTLASSWVRLYHGLMLVYARPRKQVQMLPRSGIWVAYKTWVEQLQGLEPSNSDVEGVDSVVEMTFEEFEAFCHQFAPKTLGLVNQHVVYKDDEDDIDRKDWEPIVTAKMLQDYMGLESSGDVDPGNSGELYDFLLNNLNPEVDSDAHPQFAKVMDQWSLKMPTDYGDTDRIKSTAVLPPLGYDNNLRDLLDDEFRSKATRNYTPADKSAIEDNIRWAKKGNALIENEYYRRIPVEMTQKQKHTTAKRPRRTKTQNTNEVEDEELVPAIDPAGNGRTRGDKARLQLQGIRVEQVAERVGSDLDLSDRSE